MEVEDVARVRLAAGRAAQQQRHLAVGPGVLGQVVVDAQGVLDQLSADLHAVLHDLLADRGAGVRSEVLQRGGILGAGDDDDGVLHRAVLLERGHDLARPSTSSGRWRRRCRSRLLPFWLMIVSMATAVLPVWRSPMISSRWPRPIGISASIALMPVWTGVSTPLRLMTPGATRSTGRTLGRVDRALVVDRPAERVDDAADQLDADRHLDDAARGLDRVAFLDLRVVAQDHGADGLFLEVERHAHDAAGELEQLGGQRPLQAIDLGDAVADLDDRADRARLDAGVELVDGRLDDARDVVGADCHAVISCFRCGRRAGCAAVRDGRGRCRR